ncbi:MAG: glycosyltransferase family 9 protein [Candidatus Eisenbacteria bacterium]|nr:glycosyltransferase family 9 protein [Candidatus Eisenbacteria bacterium]
MPPSCATTAGSGGRTLLARLHSLGDVVLTTGLVPILAGRGETVEILTDPAYDPVFEGLPVARVWHRDTIRSAGSFDSVVDLQANATSRRLLLGLGPRRRASSRSLARRWIVLWGRRAPLPVVPHAVGRYAEAAGFGGAESELRPRLAVTEADRAEAARHAWAMETSARPCVGLAVGASRRMKRWPEAKFDLLERSLAEIGLGSLRFIEPRPGESDRRFPGPGPVRAGLRELKALASRCKALVTNDSGVMHLAVGLGVPVVAIFGSTVTNLGFGPLGERDVVVERDLACRPCAVHGARYCWQGHERCLREIEPRDVQAAVVRILGRSPLK